MNVLYGQPTVGIASGRNQFWNQDAAGVRDVAESQDWFGRSRESGDFDGDGVADLAVGAYGETPPNASLEHAGVVQVLYGVSGFGLTVTGQQFVTEPSGTSERPEANDYFGRALAAGYFNDDPYEDLAVGADGDTRGGHPGAGCVIVLYGTDTGLDLGGGQLWAQGRGFGLKDGAEDGDGFGVALDAGDFDGDGFDDLVIGAVGEDRDESKVGIGAISIIFGSAAGLQNGSGGLDDQFITQDNDGTADDFADADDQFGRDLAVGNFNGDISSSGHPIDDLAIGARQEDVVQFNDNAGAVTVMIGMEGKGLDESAGGLFLSEEVLAGGDGAEATDDFGRGLEAGRFNGDGYDDLAIGVDFEDEGGNCPPEGGEALCLTGAVHVLSGSSSGISTTAELYLTQNAFPPESSEAHDEFGKDFQAGDFDGDGFDDLAISAWKEALEGHPVIGEAGVVHIVYGSDVGLDLGRIQLWKQNDTVDVSESGDQFGWFG